MPQINPFQNLYVTERLSSEEFVRVVSPIIVKHCAELFGSGNVILQGTQGSGKTTLLTLLETDIREAYRTNKKTFPIPERYRNFISAGINLTKSGILDIGKRPVLRGDKQVEEDNFPFLFGDFLNYHVCKELFELVLNARQGKFKSLKMNTTDNNIAKFVQQISSEDCWFGFFKKSSSIEEILERIKKRIANYRNYHQFNIDSLPKSIIQTKTNIGEPISRLARALKSCEIIDSETNVLIRIDQLEWLLECDEVRKSLGEKYRRIINSALSTRDPSVSYKIGTRTYAWHRELRLYGSEANLEKQRDYTVIDVDTTLRRFENSKGWVFRKFAADVFCRRLEFAGYDLGKRKDLNITLKCFADFWKIPERENRIVELYCRKKTPKIALNIPTVLSSAQVSLVKDIFKYNHLDALLAIAWFLQGTPPNYEKHSIPEEPYHWKKSIWWRKERRSQALLQLAANCRQSLVWGGIGEVVNLGTSGILCFLAICQHVWDVLLRMEGELFCSPQAVIDNLPIPLNVQNIGITSASTLWFNKITELPGGHDRQRFIENLGKLFRDALLSDKKMSYPGWTGFSLKAKEFRENDKVSAFIKDAVDYGILIEIPHTSKLKDDQERIKWYPNPIFCPHLRIYAQRIKEPYYAKIEEVEGWVHCAINDIKPEPIKTQKSKLNKNKKTDNSTPLFDFEELDES